MAGFFKGTDHAQDARFKNKQDKLMAEMKFPPEYETLEVDISKVQMELIKTWATSRITELMGMEDEVVSGLCFALLEDKANPPDPKNLQIQLTGFMSRQARGFVLELWEMLASATAHPSGIPTKLLEMKKKELLNDKLNADRIADGLRQKRDKMEGERRNERERPPRRSRSPRRDRSPVRRVKGQDRFGRSKRDGGSSDESPGPVKRERKERKESNWSATTAPVEDIELSPGMLAKPDSPVPEEKHKKKKKEKSKKRASSSGDDSDSKEKSLRAKALRSVKKER